MTKPKQNHTHTRNRICLRERSRKKSYYLLLLLTHSYFFYSWLSLYSVYLFFPCVCVRLYIFDLIQVTNSWPNDFESKKKGEEFPKVNNDQEMRLLWHSMKSNNVSISHRIQYNNTYMDIMKHFINQFSMNGCNRR